MPTLSLLLRRRPHPAAAAAAAAARSMIRRLSSLPTSPPPDPHPPPPPADPTPPSLSSRLSFVFDQLDTLSRPPDLSAHDAALRRIRSWRNGNRETPQHDKEENQESEEGEGSRVKEVVELVHPWPEWIELMEILAKQNYFDLRRRTADDDELSEVKEEDQDADASVDLSREWLTVRNACMNFGRDRFDIIRSLQRNDIQTLVGYGCPSMDQKVVFSAKLLRKLVHLDEGDVCSACSLRNTCSRGYILVPKEDEARTLDIMRILLTFGFDHTNGSVDNKDLMKLKQVKNVVRKLMHEVARLSATPIDPRLPPPVVKKKEVKVKQPPPPPKKRRVGRDDVEMKKGDWLCPKCDFMNFAKNTVCMQCDAKRPKRQLLPGEWECPRCKFLNYRRNMACYECEHERPPDEYTSNQMDFRQQGPRRTVSERGTPSRVPEISDAWNFDFDDNESDGADVAAFEFADSSKGGLEKGDFTGLRGRRSEVHERKPNTHSLQTGFNDFDDEDEDDDLDSYEIDSPSRAGKESGVARRSFSELEESDLDDYGEFNDSNKNSEVRSHDYLTASDNDDELMNHAYVKDRRGELKFDSDSDFDDDFQPDSAKRSLRASYSDSESDADDYRRFSNKNLKGGKYKSRSNFDRVKGTNHLGRASRVQNEGSWDQTRRRGGRFGNDDGFRGSQRNERRNGDRFDKRRESMPGKQDENFRFSSTSRHRAGNNRPDRKRFDDFRDSEPVDRPRRINVR